MSAAFESGLTALTFARRNLLTFFDDIPAKSMCYCPVEGGNHALWILGHITQTDDYFMNAVGGRPLALPQTYRELFGMGSKPTGRISDYPDVADLKAAAASQRESLIGWFKEMTADELSAPLGGELAGFASNRLNLMASMAWHEGLHTGQLTMIRRGLGQAPKFG